MAESAEKVAKQAEDRLNKVAESVRERFTRIIETRFTDRIKDGLFLDQVDHGIDRARADERRRKQGGSPQ
ncbi:hypothetical protein AB0C02_02900 [Micromonospora sp. NPDC048999]|uniref:hypothetical protein n=1 Tax=Micromonospora sp. NPDC048999 TaxID=3155391 RepID=UPI0033C4E550